jgi:hypothetical protein
MSCYGPRRDPDPAYSRNFKQIAKAVGLHRP